MTPEIGKTYRTRDGQKRGPLMFTPEEWGLYESWVFTDGLFTWRPDGSFSPDGLPDPLDLIAEWADDDEASHDS